MAITFTGVELPPPLHFLGKDGRVNEVTFQGNVLKWRVLKEPMVRKKSDGRKAIVEFSRQARFRLLTLLSSLAWPPRSRILFITLTYPDERRPFLSKKIGQHRSVFWRGWEKHLGKHCAGIWRIEWEQRQTGFWEGEYLPHFHIIALDVPFVHYEVTNDLWRKAIQWDGYCVTETRRPKVINDCAEYVAKYVAKPVSPSLVYDAYQNRPTGKHWGTFRDELLPRDAERTYRFENGIVADWLRDDAGSLLPRANWAEGEGFTLFNDKLGEIENKMRRLGLRPDGETC